MPRPVFSAVWYQTAHLERAGQPAATSPTASPHSTSPSPCARCTRSCSRRAASSTVLLAALILHERVHRAQGVGLVLCGLAVGLVAAG